MVVQPNLGPAAKTHSYQPDMWTKQLVNMQYEAPQLKRHSKQLASKNNSIIGGKVEGT